MTSPANPTPPDVPIRTQLAVDPAGRVTLSAYQEHKGLSEETVAFDCSIQLDGKKVATAMNSGQGGPNRYHFASRESEERVTELAKAWAVASGESPFEVLDAFISHLAAGVTDLKTARALFRRAMKAQTDIAGVVVVEKQPFFAWNDPSRISGFGVREFIAVSSLDDVTTIGAAKRARGWRFHVIPADRLK